MARTPVKRTPKNAPVIDKALAAARVDDVAAKMAVYGFAVSAPLSHVLVSTLQRVFAGKTSPAAKIGQILASNLINAPIQTVAFIASVAVINGAKSFEDVKRAVKANFLQTIRVTWIVSPVAIVFAQRFLAQELWVPFFNLLGFVLGTLFSYKAKQAKLRAAREKAKAKETEPEKIEPKQGE